MSGARQVGPYRLLSQLGRGAYGEVWLAEREGWADPVALKLPRARSGEHMARFAAEVEIARGLDHPGIVRALDAGQDGQQLYCALVYHPGMTLAERLRTGPLSPNEACALVHRMTLAMDHAHGRGVVHRDLKPANVIVDARTGAPWITDFGLARFRSGSALTRTGDILGTPNFMAPEQARGERKLIGPPTDVYGLGAILYYLLVGRPPFVGARTFAVIERVITEPPTPPSQLRAEISPELEEVLLKCLAKTPPERFHTCGQLRRALEPFAQG